MIRAARLVGAVALASALAGCASAVSGSGQVGSGGRSGSSRPSTPTSASTSPSSSAPAPTGRFARTPVRTAIGDPPTADLCRAVPTSVFASSGFTASYDDPQYPPGCSTSLHRGGKIVLDVTVYAQQDKPAPGPGVTTRTESGLPVSVNIYSDLEGGCERDIAAQGVYLVIDANAPTGKQPEQVVCPITDAVTAATASAIARHTVPRAVLPSPSLTAMSPCRVVAAIGKSSLPLLAGAQPHPTGYGTGCDLNPTDSFLFVNYAVFQASRPTGYTPAQLGRHPGFEQVQGTSSCAFVAYEGRSTAGYEALLFLANRKSKGVSGMCHQLARYVGQYLDTAGLK